MSRDVNFNEKKSWEWNLQSVETVEEKPGMFKVALGEYGNNGIREEDTEIEENHSNVNEEHDEEPDHDPAITKQSNDHDVALNV